MHIRPDSLANYLLCCNNFKFPMYKGHYITGKDISLFTKLACIENTLTSFTCGCNKACNSCKCLFKR